MGVVYKARHLALNRTVALKMSSLGPGAGSAGRARGARLEMGRPPARHRRTVAEPFPRRLSDQMLVELLKQPVCVGPARRAVLDHLEYQYQRPFADQWEFIRFAEEQKLGFDFACPPRRL
jgi:hypothetical protein